MDWISQNYAPLSLFVNVAVLVIWTVYAGLLYQQYSRQHQAHLVMQVTDRRFRHADCLLISLTQEAVHIRALLISGSDVQSSPVSYHVTGPVEDAAPSIRAESILRQGPMRPGDYLSLGKVESLVTPIFDEHAANGDREVRFELRVVFEQRAGRLFGASHRFVLRRVDSEWVVHADTMFTRQMTSRSDEKEVVAWLDAVRNPRAPGQEPQPKPNG
jgi:hypothetical protein